MIILDLEVILPVKRFSGYCTNAFKKNTNYDLQRTYENRKRDVETPRGSCL